MDTKSKQNTSFKKILNPSIEIPDEVPAYKQTWKWSSLLILFMGIGMPLRKLSDLVSGIMYCKCLICRNYKYLATNCVWNLEVQAHICTITGHTTKQGSSWICFETWLPGPGRPPTTHSTGHALHAGAVLCGSVGPGLMWWTWGF